MAGLSQSSHPEPGREVGTAMKARPRKVEGRIVGPKGSFLEAPGPTSLGKRRLLAASRAPKSST